MQYVLTSSWNFHGIFLWKGRSLPLNYLASALIYALHKW